MKRVLCNIKFIFFLLLIFNVSKGSFAQYAGGMGTENDPFQISNLENLQTLSLTSSDWGKHFILTSDINATDTENWNNGKGFIPIGTIDSHFYGSFHGQGYTITGLYIRRITTSNLGLFGVISGAIIKKVNLNNCYIEGYIGAGALVGSIRKEGSELSEIDSVNIINCIIVGQFELGGLAGSMDAAKVNNCNIIATVSGTAGHLGGLSGTASDGLDGEISNCSVTAEVIGNGIVGGMIGENSIDISNCDVFMQVTNNSRYRDFFGGLAALNSGTIENCSTHGEIVITDIVNNYIGGFVGKNTGLVQNCYSSASIVASISNYVGGFAGENGRYIYNCYATGPVVGQSYVGGLNGITTEWSQTSNCYSTGLITGEDKTGGLVGENSFFAVTKRCYSSGFVASDAWFSGGLIGLNRSNATTVHCFFDNETTGKELGSGMDHNGQNEQPIGLSTAEFININTFINATWSFGNSTPSPWKLGTAPDNHIRPVLFYHNYIVNYLKSEGGLCIPENMQVQIVNCGSNASAMQAVPNEGSYFIEWQSIEGDSITNENPVVISNVIRDSTIVAKFALINDVVGLKSGNVKIYPNPVHDILNIDLNAMSNIETTTFELIDVVGKTVLKLKPNSVSTQISIKQLINGIYFLNIQSDNRSKFKIIIVDK